MTARERRPPRRQARLEVAIASSRSPAERAQAHYEFGLFHDNNSRETEAIPHYEAALTLGLSGETRAQCLAWLASSLHKTGRPQEALAALQDATSATSDRDLMKFLEGLKRRVMTAIALGALKAPN